MLKQMLTISAFALVTSIPAHTGLALAEPDGVRLGAVQAPARKEPTALRGQPHSGSNLKPLAMSSLKCGSTIIQLGTGTGGGYCSHDPKSDSLDCLDNDTGASAHADCKILCGATERTGFCTIIK